MVLKYFLFILGIYTCVTPLWTTQTLDHSNCKFKFIEGGVSKSDANYIINKHNYLRRLIANGKVLGQPRGTNLKRLKWDSRLAKQAQFIANTCVYSHVLLNDSRWFTGQNLYRRKSTKFEKETGWDRAIQTWFNEHERYTYSTDKRVKGTGHYTQMIWATTEFIGCGYSYFETKEKMKYQKLYVCNYGPGGNIRGILPYKTGSRGCENLC